MSQFFWALKRGTSDILRTFTGEFDRMAWMHVGKLRLDEGEEVLLIHDRSLRKPYEDSKPTRRDYEQSRGEARHEHLTTSTWPSPKGRRRAATTAEMAPRPKARTASSA